GRGCGTPFRRKLSNLLFFFKPLGMQDASKKLTESLHEVYEPEWYGREDVKTVGEFWFWDSFQTRIAKRSRKLVDYDSARHHLEALQGSKRRDEGRITKAEEEFQKAQKVFEDFNTDLQEELPSLWSRRVGFYVTTFKNIYSLEAKFHKEILLVAKNIIGPLRISKTPSPPEETSPLPSPEASPNHTLAPASPAPARPKSPSQLRKGPPVPPLPKLTPTKELQQENIISLFDDNFVPEISVTTPSQVSPWKNSLSVHLIPMGQFSYSSIPSVVIEPASNNEGEGEEHEVIVNESKDAVEDISSTQDTESNTSEVVSEPKTIVEIQPASSEDHPVSADGGMPPGFLFKVEALHDFEAANNDELDLKRGDIVLVIPSDTSADQDAGWLTGVKESDWLQYKETVPYKGLFPENFTQRLE
uniref:Amphiphysin n=1 Tax=Sphenodon punctatus TaxID=8508 RepID=A0A8D0G2Z9_SPHPU